MKVWHGVFIIFLIAVVIMLAIGYMNLSDAYRTLLYEKNSLLEEYKTLSYEHNKNNEEVVESVEENPVVEEEETTENNERKLFYEVIKNEAEHYEIYDYLKTEEENIEIYIDLLTFRGIIIPEFTNFEQIDSNYLSNLFVNMVCDREDKSYLDNGDMVFHKDLIDNSFKKIFGNEIDTNKINLEDAEIYLLEGYDDVYARKSYFEWSELWYPRCLITDYKENGEDIEVNIIEYTLEDDSFVLDEKETTKRRLYNSKGEEIKVYDVEGVQTEDILFDEVKDNGIVVTDEDIEKYILDNKDKFEMKKLTFKQDGSNITFKSCEVVK